MMMFWRLFAPLLLLLVPLPLASARSGPIPTSCQKSGQVVLCHCDKNAQKPNFAYTPYSGHNLFKQIAKEIKTNLDNTREIKYNCDHETKLHLAWTPRKTKLGSVEKITLSHFKSITLQIDLDLRSLENPPNITILLKDIGGGYAASGEVSARVGGRVTYCRTPCVSTKTSPLLMTDCNKCSYSIFSLKFERVSSVELSNLHLSARPDDEGHAVLAASGVDKLDMVGGSIDRVDKSGLRAKACFMNGKPVASCNQLKTPPQVADTEASQGSNLPLISLLVIILVIVVVLISAGCYFLVTRNALGVSDEDEEGVKEGGMERLNESSH